MVLLAEGLYTRQREHALNGRATETNEPTYMTKIST